MARAGHLGFVSQSGALGTAILDWSLREHVGFSLFASLGSMLDVGWADLIDFLADDPQTRCIALYMETIGDARSFLTAAREASLAKPIVVLKAGRTERAARAVRSHTGALAGADDALEAAFRRCGALRVDTIDELFATAEALAIQPHPQGRRLAVVTNAGGPGVVAADALAADGGELAELDPRTIAALDDALPPLWSHGNPVDVLGDADPARFAKAVEVVAADANSDGLLVVLTPQAMTDPTRTAEGLRPFARLGEKPIFVSWMGGAGVAAGEAILTRAGIPCFPYPEEAARAFMAMWRLDDARRGLYETPTLPKEADAGAPDRALVETILRSYYQAGKDLLSEFDSKRLLAAYGIPTVETRVARGEAEAVAAAEAVGFPVVLKLHSKTLTHKTDVGGVRLGLANATAVRRAYKAIQESVRARAGIEHFAGVTVQPMIEEAGYELLIGSAVDEQLGPVIMFGSGGIMTEVYRDRALGLPPLNSTLALRLMERTKVFRALGGIRGRKPIDLEGLEHLLVRFSRLVAEQPRIKEIDINPLLATPERLIALDARVILHGPEVADARLPRLAIRPYPSRFEGPWTLADGTAAIIRPVRPEDEPLFARFHETLSDRSVYHRYFHQSELARRVEHERLRRVCFIDYDREMALAAEVAGETSGGRAIVGVARMIKIRHSDRAEFGLVISDRYQRLGLGRELLRRLMRFAREEGLARLATEFLAENETMQRLCSRFGATSYPAGSLVRAEFDLTRPEPAEPKPEAPAKPAATAPTLPTAAPGR
jgi:acetyltransferase